MVFFYSLLLLPIVIIVTSLPIYIPPPSESAELPEIVLISVIVNKYWGQISIMKILPQYFHRQINKIYILITMILLYAIGPESIVPCSIWVFSLCSYLKNIYTSELGNNSQYLTIRWSCNTSRI